ncbi:MULTISPECIES: GTP cyclohydrolase IIa [Metallosphaera]|uniref:GTP cyclohydrolase III n=4 Tax=Metallosphaera TaxID=41980 RepID=A4YCS4_METS5|nr:MULTISPECIES: GTP cyclohydrolase IIa [Metallosphaera]ABP94226.1 GTP cyclohydrolase IIa [Metallosphaera sedula DSM 5348]AIM26213.1 GTP cyclohydrolase IIa [Metallosphaera sedula]MCY0862531.1 GTP cyclohydrolase IIa [Metallosphaera prunae]WPX07485.1 GTP cyclohydrolase IIa [Metallosphaera sedula DSM 5348]BBL45966.1 GTP cyclohydrolase III [Metallosphaera sedula]
MVVELYNYREWTELLGNDREWKIQVNQHLLSSKMIWKASQMGGMVFPMRYDQAIMLADGIKPSDLRAFLHYVSRVAPVNIRACLGYGETPRRAEENGYSCLKGLEPGTFQVLAYPDSPVAVAHFDLNGFTDFTNGTSTYRSFTEAQKFYSEIVAHIYSLGGIAQYMGGDNIVTVISTDVIDQVIAKVENEQRMKVGIGIGKNARDAMRNATKALTEIRKDRRETWKLLQE